MKIFINSRIYQEKYSGIQNYILNLYSRILLLDTEDQFTFLQTKDNKTLWNTHVTRWIHSGLGNVFFDWFLTFFIARKNGAHIFHGPSFTLPIFRRKDMKYVVTIHDLAFILYPEQYSWIFRKYMWLTLLNALKKADCIISISESTKRDILYYFPFTQSSRIEVVPLWVSSDFFDVKVWERLVEEKYFFSLTTHPKRKNILRILDVIAENKELFSGYTYIIAGILIWDNKETLEKKIRELGLTTQVRLFGYASDRELKNLYQNAEFSLYPSYYEWFWLPVLEAMASGCPVLSSNTSSLPEVNPNEACRFNPNDNTDIKEKMYTILTLQNEERNILIEKNKVFARSMTWEKTANKTLEIFASLSPS